MLMETTMLSHPCRHSIQIHMKTTSEKLKKAFELKNIHKPKIAGILRKILAESTTPVILCLFLLVSVAHSTQVSAQETVFKNEFAASHSVVPICNDGSLVNLLEFTLTTSSVQTLTGLSLSMAGTTDLSDIAELGVVHITKAGNREFTTTTSLKAESTLNGRLEFRKGEHKFRLTIRIKKNAELLHRVGIQVCALQFEDGTTLDVAPIEGAQPQRLAYPIHHRHGFDCHTFRIPGIAKANNGDLLAVYDMRYNSQRDLQEDIDIGISRSSDGGQTWSDPVAIMDMGEFGGKPQKENGCSDPGILVDRQTGEIFVAACWTHGKPNTHQWVGNGSEPGLDIHHSTQFMVVRSSDDGKSWADPENWTTALKDPSWHLFAPAPGNGITMNDGRLVFPTQGRGADGLPFSNISWSDDHGKTWNVSSHARKNTTECSIAELSDGRLMLNMRDNRNRKLRGENNGRAISTTRDLGKTWNRHSSDHSLLPEPTCMASLIASEYKSGHILLFSNPRNENRRSGMTVQMSTDDGSTWPVENRILLDTRGGAYSSLVVIDDETIGILYESSVADMVFQKIPLADFIR